eukprot:403353140
MLTLDFDSQDNILFGGNIISDSKNIPMFGYKLADTGNLRYVKQIITTENANSNHIRFVEPARAIILIMTSDNSYQYFIADIDVKLGIVVHLFKIDDPSSSFTYTLSDQLVIEPQLGKAFISNWVFGQPGIIALSLTSLSDCKTYRYISDNFTYGVLTSMKVNSQVNAAFQIGSVCGQNFNGSLLSIINPSTFVVIKALSYQSKQCNDPLITDLLLADEKALTEQKMIIYSQYHNMMNIQYLALNKITY